MPSGLRRYQQTRSLHFITFSCYRRGPELGTIRARCVFERSLESIRKHYSFAVVGYVVMPEHVHLLVSEPEAVLLARAIQALKQSVARKLALRRAEPFWQARYYDFNVWSNEARGETAVHAPQSGSARLGGAARRLALVELQALSNRG